MYHPSDHDVALSEEEFRLLRDFIHERFGLFFDDSQQASLRARLLGRLSSLDLLSFEDYYHYLRFGPERQDELQRMVGHLTNNETYFFREQGQLGVFAENVLRDVRERKLRGAGSTHNLLAENLADGYSRLGLVTAMSMKFAEGTGLWTDELIANEKRAQFANSAFMPCAYNVYLFGTTSWRLSREFNNLLPSLPNMARKLLGLKKIKEIEQPLVE